MRARSVSLVVGCLMAMGAGFPALSADDGSSSMDSIWLDAPQPAPAGESPNPASPKPTTTTTPKSNKTKSSPASKESKEAKESKESKEPAAVAPSLTPAPAIETSADSAAGTTAAPSTATTTGGAAPAETPPNTVAPMVTLDYFKTSSLVTKGGWPGVGPFKEEGSPLDLSDPNGNRLKVDVSGTQVTRAELNLQKPSSDFLDVQMNADFLLESVGVKPKKIVEFNEQLEKNRTLVTKGDGMPNMTVGRYFVAIQKSTADSSALAISVNSLDADRSALQAHSVSPETPPQTPGNKIAGIFGLNKTPQTSPTTTQPAKTQPVKTTPAKTTPPATTGGSTAAASPGGDLKETFQTLVRNWQNLKKTAVRQKQTGELSQFLAGQALSRQTTAIKWLVDNKQYYDITPQSVVVEKVSPVTAGSDKKFLVATVIKEHSKRCEDAGKVVLDKDDTYKVNYTIEKIGDRWFIVDSAVPSATAKPAAGGKTGR